MLKSIVGALALLTLTLAQTITRTTASASQTSLPTGIATVSLFVPGADPQPLVASVISSNASVTAYSINCPPGTDSSDCGVPAGANLTVSSTSIYEFTATLSSSGLIYKCTLTTPAVCAETLRSGSAIRVGVQEIPQASVTYLPVVVTATASGQGASASASRSAASTSAARSGSASGAANSSSAGNAANPMEHGHHMGLAGLFAILLGLL